MKFLKTLFNFYINASIHVALAVFSLLKITEIYFGLASNEAFSYVVFFGTITGYNFVKYAPVAKLYHKSLTKNLKIIQVLSFLCFVFLCFYGIQLPLKTLVWFTPFLLLTILYAVPIPNKNLRNIASLKIIIIALVWAGVTVLSPVINAEETFDYKILLSFIQRFLFVIVLTLPFDIRDVKYDAKNLQTIPQKVGVEQTKKIGFVLLALTLLIEFFIAPNSSFKTVFLIVFVILLVLLQRATIQQKKYYASFWVEGIPILWCILLLVFSKFAI